jgi:putative toxin-antitoxin system antitoxin component (TIGR02293 family)
MTTARKPSARPGRPGFATERPEEPTNSLGLKTGNVVELARQVKEGLPYGALTRLQRQSQLPLDAIAGAVRIPRRTLARRKGQGRLTGPESERLLRLATVFDRAVALFDGDAAGARAWLQSPTKALGNQTPLATVETEVGARAVEDLIGRLEHGVFS